MNNSTTKMNEEQLEYYLDEVRHLARARKALQLLSKTGNIRELRYYENQWSYHNGQVQAFRRIFLEDCIAVSKSDAYHDSKLEGELCARLFYETTENTEGNNEEA